MITAGVILSAVVHKERQAAPFLVVLDAKTMNEVGRVEFQGIQMHKDFHGIFQHLWDQNFLILN